MVTYVVGDIHGRSRLLDQLERDLPWDIKHDKIVFLGDLIDRGDDAPGVVVRVMRYARENPNVVVLRGNHEQMFLNYLDRGDPQWLVPENGGPATVEAYGAKVLEDDEEIEFSIPDEHVEFMRGLPFFHEDELAIYVHAGLVPGVDPSETDPEVLLWTRDARFFRQYNGKLCIFGHTPTVYLPRDGCHRHFGIYIHGDCVGIDTSGEQDSPLSCLRVDNFTLYQAYPRGVTEVKRLSHLKNRNE